MSHDLYASWATAELASKIAADPSLCFEDPPGTDDISTSATREGSRTWPISDGVLTIETTSRDTFDVAVELKRENEGLHGVLTAIGQSHAYLHKGFRGALVVIPEKYSSHDSPGHHVSEIIRTTSENLPIGVFTYGEPDTDKPSPFSGKLSCHRSIALDSSPQIASAQNAIQRVTTQWGHVREGSSDAHAFFLYLETAKMLRYSSSDAEDYDIPTEMRAAVRRINPDADAIKYLSYSVGDDFHNRVWRRFWFTNIINPSTSLIWKGGIQPYEPNEAPSRIRIDNGYKYFFAGRSDSIKNRLVRKLNDNEISNDEAWEQYVKNVRSRAHSYREDIDSGLEALGLLESDGKPSELGYKFVDNVERTGSVFSGTAKAILGAALLKNADLGAFLHYIYHLSAERFSTSPLEFSEEIRSGYKFDGNSYLNWLEDQFANNLKVMRKVSSRGGKARRPFQAELSILRKYGCVSNFRVGLGLEINWPKVQEYLDYEL